MFKRICLFIIALTSSFWAIAEPLQQINAEFLLAMKPQPILLDVRSVDEFNAGFIKGAINVEYDQLAQNKNVLMPYQQQDVVIYCRSGRRAGIAADWLIQNGFNKVSLLEGHILQWNKQGLPLEKVDVKQEGK